jgi:hypothetical protein
MLVVSWMDEELEVLDTRTLKITRRTATGHNSRGFGTFLWRPGPVN